MTPVPSDRSRIRRLTRAAGLLWSLLLLLSALWSFRSHSATSYEFARIDAQAAYRRDLLYRRWATGHGGVYVPETARTPANPHLAHIPERDLVTPSGRRLTLVNPAYMTRQVYELGYSSTGASGHITSLNPIRPENAPDPWERQALLAFERGDTFALDLSEKSGEAQLRLMQPFVTEAGCLKCHAAQGYKVGDIRGGISISVPIAPHRAILLRELREDLLSHAAVWLLGILAIGFGGRSLRRSAAEREEAAARTAAERERFLVTLRSIGDGVMTTDLAGRIALMNPVAEELTGWGAEEAAGRPLPEVFRILHEETREPCANPVERVLATGSTVGLANHTVLVSRDGGERSIADSGAPIRDERGEMTGVVLVFRDVTERRRVDEAMRNAQRLESLGLLAGGIAHDFNNLLGGLFGFLEFARGSAESGDAAAAAKDLRQAVDAFDRARALTSQLLTFAKGDAPVRRPLALAPLLEKSARFALSGSSVELRLQFAPDLALCDADAGRIAQVADNLVLNARQAMRGGGTITMRAENVPAPLAPAPLPPGEYVCFSVSDTGPGIPAAHLPRIFDPFYTTKRQGSGLGLAIVHSIAQSHDGLVTVESTPGEGTTFRVFLPRATGEALRPEERVEPARRGGGRLLVMDDEAYLREVLARMARHLGYEAETAEGAEDALALFQAARDTGRPFDLVLLDLTIPGGPGGHEVLARMRALDPRVRAVASSGYSEDPVMSEPLAHGFASSLRKPFLLKELSAALATAESAELPPPGT